MDTINLNDPKIMSAADACQLWGIESSTLRKAVDRFPNGSIRKFGKQWVVTIEGMETVFGTIRVEEELDLGKLQTTYNTIKAMATDFNLSVKQFPNVSNQVVVIENSILVWLANMHWKEVLAFGDKFTSRDYGGKDTLKEKLTKVAQERAKTIKSKPNISISKYNILKDEYIELLVRRSLNK